MFDKMNICKVKICGTTSVGDALMIAEAGANYSGIAVEIPYSERAVSVEKAAAIARATPIPSVALFIDMPIEFIESAVEKIKPFAVQLLGHESPEFVAKLKKLRRRSCEERSKLKQSPCQVWKSICLPVKGQAAVHEVNPPSFEKEHPPLKKGAGGFGKEGTERSERVCVNDIKIQMDSFVSAGADALLLDTVDVSGDKLRFGGTGKTSDWNIARELVKEFKTPVFLAGGINPDNVREAIQTVRPYGIDLCSGVESVKGKRDREKVNRLMRNLACFRK
jgi:phosphoribosylanthranilate isomerase